MLHRINQATIDELDLGSSVLTGIPYGAFYGVEIGGELKIPDTVTSIDIAFVDSKLGTVILPTSLETSTGAPCAKAVVDKVVIPEGTKTIPSHMFIEIEVTEFEVADTLEYIGEDAFYHVESFDEDIDFPNLYYIGNHAFMRTSVGNVVLHDKMEYLGEGAFLFTPTLTNLTFDCDLFGLSGYNNFYSVFSTVAREKNYQDQRTDSSTFGDIVFTEKNTTTPRGAAFVFLDINSIDISNTKWQSIGYANFFETTIHEPFDLPSSITMISGSAFQQGHF